MANRIFHSLIFVCIVSHAADAAAAKLKRVGDGCDELRSIVIAQTGNNVGGTGGQAILQDAKGAPVISDPPQYCLHTAAATTAAFSMAMISAGIPVTWGMNAIGPPDHCDSRDLSRCYPQVHSAGLPGARDLRFVHDTWKAVSRSIVDVMPYGVNSDMAVFETAALAVGMGGRLRSEMATSGIFVDLPAARGGLR